MIELRMHLSRGKVSLFAWPLAMGLVLTLYCSVYGAMFTELENQKALLTALPEAMTKMFDDNMITSGAGFVDSVFFSLLGFVLLTIAAITWGQSLTVAPFAAGELELVLAHGFSRSQYFWQRTLAILLRSLLAAIVVAAVLLLLNQPNQLSLTPAGIAAAIVCWQLHGLLIAGVTAAAGAATKKRNLAVAAGATLAVASFLTQALGKMLDSLSWLLNFSPLHWLFHDNPLETATLPAAATAVSILTLLSFISAWRLFLIQDLT